MEYQLRLMGMRWRAGSNSSFVFLKAFAISRMTLRSLRPEPDVPISCPYK